MASFTTITFGCRVNEAETEEITQNLLSRGMMLNHRAPDVIMINSCAVTAKAEREVRQTIYQLQKKHPHASIVITGCAATRWIQDKKTGTERIHLVPNEKKQDVADIVFTLAKTKKTFDALEKSANKFLQSGRAMIKIQDGCHRFCSYCIVPYLRGKPVSKTINDICAQIRGMDGKITDVTLAAINTEAFGKDTGETLISLIQSVLEKTSVSRLSFGSIHPWSINEEFLEYYKILSQNPRFIRFFHIPIQSGCQKTLARMNRQYDIANLEKKIKKIITIAPDTFIGTDVIVGFPGETDDEFEETYKFLSSSSIHRFHVFRYSSRPGTTASTMEKTLGTVSADSSKQRSKRLLKLSEKKFADFKKTLIGKTGLSLPLVKRKIGVQEALLWNQVPIDIVSSTTMNPGTLHAVKVTSCTDGTLLGIPL